MTAELGLVPRLGVTMVHAAQERRLAAASSSHEYTDVIHAGTFSPGFRV